MNRSNKPPTSTEGQATGRGPQDKFSDISETLEKQIGNLVQGKAKEQVVSRVLAIFKQEAFSGPIPHPRHLAAYEDICPGAADRILKMAEDELLNQIALSKTSVDGEITDRRIGMWFGFGALLALILAAVYCAIHGQAVIAGTFIGVGALGTVSRFIGGRHNGQQPPQN